MRAHCGLVSAMLLLLATTSPAQEAQFPIGSIDFFGYLGIDLASVRAALPIRTGDVLKASAIEETKQRVQQFIREKTKYEAKSVNIVCCSEKGGWMIYIGLNGQSSKSLVLTVPPTGAVKLDAEGLARVQKSEEALLPAVRSGAAEDDSQGYALSADPALRAAQLAMRDYAIHHTKQILEVLKSSSDVASRQAAAELLGYDRQSPAQIEALVAASRDADAGVRNNATRALLVMASAAQKPAGIPADGFIDMLNSPDWTDRNKGGYLLMRLTETRDAQLLNKLKAQALPSLIEMARWREIGHAYPFRIILGRIGGIEESRLEMLASSDQIAPILERVCGSHCDDNPPAAKF
jgi:hypothetical protein